MERPVGNRTVFCPKCAGPGWYADVIRDNGWALGDADLKWKDGIAHHVTCGGGVKVAGGVNAPKPHCSPSRRAVRRDSRRSAMEISRNVGTAHPWD